MFYDLNHWVDGIGDQSRREMVAVAMQLGYCGVAANHMFTGVMADSDRCKFRPLELQSVLAAAPDVAKSARFHRELLGVPAGTPFRQFSRITVVIDNQAQASALNPGNPVLKTYDLVAARPTNQKVFNQACSQLEIDLISLDVSQKLPFRLKMPAVKTALQRGIYFEVCYGQAIFDPKARRELFANAKMLLAAARGQNIIVSSGARRALELRGPNDAANMSTLFGLTLESAKAAVSRNCKSVVMHGAMRKATYRGAIHIESAMATENSSDALKLFNVPSEWDPLSIGGASADFIPMDETTETEIGFNYPSSTISTKSKGNSEIKPLAGDTKLVTSNIDQPSLQSLGIALQSANEHRTLSRKKMKRNLKTGGSDQLHLQEASAEGLRLASRSSDVPESMKPSAISRKEKKTDIQQTQGGKRTHTDTMMAKDTESLRSGQKKAKRRKKK